MNGFRMLARPLLALAAMNISLYQAAAAMDNATRWQEVTAENLAASSIPGFKRQELSFEAIQSGLYPVGRSPDGRVPQMLLPSATPVTSFQQGDLRRTDVPSNLALQGPGFFQVQFPSGQVAYTRDGEFTTDAEGRLVTKEGYAVLGESGPIQIDPNLGPFAVGPNGDVTQGTARRGRLMVAEFPDPGQLARLSAGYFAPADPATQPAAAATTTVRQGFLEGANTSSVLEMANLLAAMRTFESNQRLIQLHDERASRAIHELGSPS